MAYRKRYAKFKAKTAYRGVRRRRYLALTRAPYRIPIKNIYGKYNKYNMHSYKRTLQLSNMANVNTSHSVDASITTNTDYLVLTPSYSVGQNIYGLSLGFALNDLPDATEFTTLYDCYRLRGVKLKLYPLVSQGIQFGNGTLEGTVLHYVTDYDDNGAVTADSNGLAAIKQYDSYKCKINRSGMPYIGVFIKPRFSQTVYKTALASGYTEGDRKLWLDCQNPEIPHYGFKCLFEHYHATTDAASLRWKVEATYYFQCKDVR